LEQKSLDCRSIPQRLGEEDVALPPIAGDGRRCEAGALEGRAPPGARKQPENVVIVHRLDRAVGHPEQIARSTACVVAPGTGGWIHEM